MEWKKGNHDEPLPIISNKLSITNFFEVYDTFAGDYIVQNKCLINWVLRDDVVVGPATTLTPNQSYFTTHGSAEEEMVHPLAHSHPFYKADNATVYDLLVIATLGSQYASTIVPFKIVENGRGSINALKS